MTTPPSTQKKHKSKKSKRGAQDSPGSSRFTGHQWVHHPSNPQLLIPSGKSDCYGLLEGLIDIDSVICNGHLPGGVIHSTPGNLYTTVTSVQNTHLSDHIPLRSDSVLVHPVTMAACNLPIASPVVVTNPCATVRKEMKAEGISQGREEAEGAAQGGVEEEIAVVCRVWPLASLPLDVVAIGATPLLGLQLTSGGMVRISSSPILLRPPVAGDVELEICQSHGMEVLLTRSFENYLLHMHDGYFVCEGNYLSVQYYGEERRLLVKYISPFDPEEPLKSSPQNRHSLRPLTPVEEDTVANKLFDLSLSPGPALESQTQIDGAKGRPQPPTVYKVTTKTKMRLRAKMEHTAITPDGPKLTSFAGARKQVELLKELVLYPLQESKSRRDGLLFPLGVILHGPPGVGKSLLAQALCNETRAHSILLSASELLFGTLTSEGMVQNAFKEARKHAPCIIILDDLHILCPHRNSSPSENERKSTAALMSCLDDLNRQPPTNHVVVIATTNQIEGVEPSLRRPGRLDREVEIPVPSARERREILSIHLRRIKNTVTDEELVFLADSAHGHVGADLYAVGMAAQQKAFHRSLACVPGEGVRVSVGDMQDGLREVRPSAMREVAIEVPKVFWTDIGGQEEVKQRMREAVEWPLKHPETFLKLGIRPPRGVLLFGPPGCSKTMVARALATESGLNFIAVKGPELFSKWVGDSEKAVRQLFNRARAAAPAIIFFDEIDALAVQRKSEGSSVADRVLAQLLTEMDGVETLTDVLIVAATNRPDMIDKALLRPGRIDRMVYVPLPDDNTRRQILEIQFRRTPVGDDVELDSLVAKTIGLSGAEVVSVCQEAALSAMHESITCEVVCQRHFALALQTVQPQTESNMIEFYDNYNAGKV